MDADYLRSKLNYNPVSGVFRWRENTGTARTGSVAGTLKKTGYRAIQIDGREWYEHVLAWIHTNGEKPHLQIDHVDRNRSNNSIANLRLATLSQQRANTKLHASNKNGVRGVKWRSDRKKWRAEIMVNGVLHNVGSFSTIEEAGAAYQLAAIKHYGEYASQPRQR